MGQPQRETCLASEVLPSTCNGYVGKNNSKKANEEYLEYKALFLLEVL